MQITLSPETRLLMQHVADIISPSYLVGGSVRDILLGKTPNDYDFTTPLLPDEIEAAIRSAGKKPYLIGKKYGTIGVKIDDHFVEITTFRTETYSEGSRKPDVAFIDSINHDLSRRDFTINAMALRSNGVLIDPFGGYEDLQNKLIRTVNKPFERFNEDPLRLLRAARFVAELSFTVDEETKESARKKSEAILHISKERWTKELDKLLAGDNVANGLHFLADTHLLHFMLPELAIQIGFDQDSPYHELDLWSHTLKTVSLTHSDVTLRWAALFHDIGKPYVQIQNQQGYSNYPHHSIVGAEIVGKIGAYLRWPTKKIEMITTLVKHHLDDHSPIGEADSDARYQ